MLITKEHIELMSAFEKEFKGERLDKEDKTLWPLGVLYQDGMVNKLFLAYRRGYAFGSAVERLNSACQ